MGFSAFERYGRLMELATIEVVAEEQSSDYESGRVHLESGTWRIRTARVTPTKPGAFVAVWERTPEGGTTPYGTTNAHDGLLVFVEEGPRFGAFTFTPEHLVELGVLTTPRAPGKRGFRVYPGWNANLNPTAKRTRAAQARAFADLTIT